MYTQGAIGGVQRPDDLTLTSATAQPVNLQQAVSLTGDLRVTKAGSFTIGSTVVVDGDLVIDAATMVLFSGNVTVGGDLTITDATGVTFAGMLTVGGTLTIANSTGTSIIAGTFFIGASVLLGAYTVAPLGYFQSLARVDQLASLEDTDTGNCSFSEAQRRDPRLCACYACPKLHVTAHSEEESVAAQHGHNDAVRAMHNIAAILKEFGVEDDDLGLYRE
jgi:hypothetical protein